MASKNTASIALFLALNLLFFTLIANASDTFPSPPMPTPSPPSPPNVNSCPIDVLKLGVCANVLNGLLNIILVQPPIEPCCSLIQDLADVSAAVCLCTAIKANILGINLNVPISLSLLLNVCSKELPEGFQCA